MTAFGLWMMAVSNTVVILLTGYCFYRVLTTSGARKHEHAPLEIDTRDADPPAKNDSVTETEPDPGT